MDTDIWRNDESRQKNVNKIMDTLQRHMPQTGPDGMNELKKIALGFEDKIYTHATSQIDYLRRISLKMLSLESKASQPSFSGSSSSNNQRPLDAAQQSTLQQTYRSALHHQQQHQQQLQQRLGQQNNVSNMQQQQNQLQQLLQSKHQQTQQTSPSSLLQSQSQQLQQLSQQQQLFSELQSQSQPLQQQQPLLHQSNPTQQELQQSSIEQQNQLLQQRGLSEASSSSMESSDQPGQSTVADCQEKVYQRLQNLKDMYYPEIKEILTKLQLKCQQPMAPNKLEKLQHYINTLQRMIKYFQVQKSRGFKEDKIDAFEKQIQAILNSFKQRKSAPQQLPNQIVSQVQSMQLREEQS